MDAYKPLSLEDAQRLPEPMRVAFQLAVQREQEVMSTASPPAFSWPWSTPTSDWHRLTDEQKREALRARVVGHALVAAYDLRVDMPHAAILLARAV